MAALLKQTDRYSVFQDQWGKSVEWDMGGDSPTLAEIQEAAAKEFPEIPADKLSIYFSASTRDQSCSCCRHDIKVIFLSR